LTRINPDATGFNAYPPHPPLEKGGEGGFEREFSEQKNPVYILNLLS